MQWKQLFFRLVGIICLFGGIFAFYDFGKELLPLFEQFLKKQYDSFELFTVLSSFFFGALALVWVGIRCITLRSFSSTWLYFALLPITVWLQNVYDMGLIFSMDTILSFSVVYFCIYIYVLAVTKYAHKNWFTPISHESLRYVGIEHQGKTTVAITPWLLTLVVLMGLIVIHPADLSTTLRMLFSPFVYLYTLVI